MTKPNHLQIHQMTIAQFEQMFPDEDACKAYLTRHRWPLGIRCARCGMDGCYDLSKSRPFHWQCHSCAPQGYRFSVVCSDSAAPTHQMEVEFLVNFGF